MSGFGERFDTSWISARGGGQRPNLFLGLLLAKAFPQTTFLRGFVEEEPAIGRLDNLGSSDEGCLVVGLVEVVH